MREKDNMKFKIAVVQFKIVTHDPETNLRRMELFIKKAGSAGADIVVFPEGVTAKNMAVRKDLADRKRFYVNRIRDMARCHKIDMVFSLVRKVAGRFLNTCYYIDKGGKILCAYDKVNLWLTERSYIDFGKKAKVFKTRFGTFGLSVCWDLFFPELYRDMARKGAEVVFCPAFWQYLDAGPGRKYDPDAEVNGVNAVCTARAFENEFIMVFCNAAGPHLNISGARDALIGRSQICIPFKGVLKRLDHNREAMFVQEVDTTVLKVAEKAYEIRSDLAGRLRRAVL
jgi:predicted amidohydrolase